MQGAVGVLVSILLRSYQGIFHYIFLNRFRLQNCGHESATHFFGPPCICAALSAVWFVMEKNTVGL